MLQISYCFNKIGINKSDTSVLVVEVAESGNSSMDSITALIKGEEVDMGRLSSLTDEKTVKAMYKITDAELSVGSLSEAVVSRIATKHFISYS